MLKNAQLLLHASTVGLYHAKVFRSRRNVRTEELHPGFSKVDDYFSRHESPISVHLKTFFRHYEPSR